MREIEQEKQIIVPKVRFDWEEHDERKSGALCSNIFETALEKIRKKLYNIFGTLIIHMTTIITKTIMFEYLFYFSTLAGFNTHFEI